MEGGPSWRKEKKSKGNNDKGDRHIREIVVQELAVAVRRMEAAGSRAVAVVAARLHLGEVEDKVEVVLAVGLMMLVIMQLSLGMDRDQLMMEAVKAGEFLQLVLQAHLLAYLSLITLI